jgi:hypothetical protein
MIIETAYQAGDTVTIKTVGGEEIVGKLIESSSESHKLSKPMKVMVTPQGIGLGPLAFTIHPDSKVEIKKTAVLFIAKTDAEMAKQYIASSTGIIL